MHRASARALLVVSILLAAALARADGLTDDLIARRAHLMDRLGPDTMLVLFSAPPRVYSRDVDYEYRQDSDLYYFTGMTQERTALVLMPGNASRREILFVADRNPEREHWTGHVLDHQAVSTLTGVATVASIADLDEFVAAMFSRRPFRRLVDADEASAFFQALGAGRARLALAMNTTGPDDPPSPARDFLRTARDRYAGFVAVDATPAIDAMRLVKSPYELTQLTRAIDISVQGHLAGARAAAPGAYEYEVKAAVEAAHRSRGASWSYPSIVASGPNANVLHYPYADRQMQAGELLLIDAAATFGYEAADVTRTYPVGGRFSPAQADIYAVVLDAHDKAAASARPGATLADIHDRAVEALKAGLLKLGLITDPTSRQYEMWFTHGTSHFIGLDVHDVGERTDTLAPGMTFTIEPGLYIRRDVLDRLPKTDANLALIAAIRAAVDKYDGIGIRIEDSFVMEPGGARNLSSALPATLEGVEALMRARPAPPSDR